MQTGPHIPILIITLFMGLACDAQISSGTPETTAVNQNYRLSEKIILETDRDAYLAGDVIHFTCFVYEPLLKRRIDLSKVAYVEFYSDDNIPVRQIKTRVNEGFGTGSIEIPKDLSSGRYYIRAYTNFMKNAGCEGFSYISVIVLNPIKEFNQVNLHSSTGEVLQKCTLYPEGGQVTCQAENKIVCTFSDESGRPVPCEARVLDHNDQLIATFTTNAYGLGSFVFTPLASHRYRIEATAGSSTVVENIYIPEHAVSLQKIQQDDQVLEFRLLRFQDGLYPLSLEIYHAGNQFFLASVLPEDSVVSIPVGTLPRGIIQFRLRTEDNEVLSTRYIYVPPQQESALQLYTNKQAYNGREAAELILKGKPEGWMNGSLSVSVFLADQLIPGLYSAEERQKFQLSALYPFLIGSPYPAREAMKDSLLFDHVLIAGQPAGITDSTFSQNDYSHLEYLPEIHRDLIFGTVLDLQGNPVDGATVMQTWIDTVNHMKASTTDDEGRFFLESELTGSREIVLSQVGNANGQIFLQKEFYGMFLPHARENFSIQPGSLEKLKQQSVVLQINDAFAGPVDPDMPVDLAPFYLDPDRVFLMDDYVSMSTLEEFLFEIVPGIFPSRRRDRTIIQIVNPAMDVPFGDRPLFLVDGLPVFDSDVIAKLKCVELYSVGVLYEKCFLQDLTFDGILYIRTRKGDASVLEAPDNVFSDAFIGIQNPVTGLSDGLPASNPREPFFRSQLYWNPSVELNADGETRIAFAAPDNAGDYLVRCGVKKPDGTLVYYYTTFVVH